MSSLISSASTWSNDDSNKKRQSTMRKTIKLRSEQSDYDETTPELEKYGRMKPPTIDDQVDNNDNRNMKINDLLTKMTSIDSSNGDNKMGDFKPMTPPSLNVKRDIDTSTEVKQYIPPMPSYLKATLERSSNNAAINYGFRENSNNNYSNYQRSYEPPAQLANKPYYANMGITASNSPSSDKLLEKINYMIHLLEENQHEKTNHITEEFILYTFLGIFIIFVVDSFSKGSGKYVR